MQSATIAGKSSGADMCGLGVGVRVECACVLFKSSFFVYMIACVGVEQLLMLFSSFCCVSAYLLVALFVSDCHNIPVHGYIVRFV